MIYAKLLPRAKNWQDYIFPTWFCIYKTFVWWGQWNHNNQSWWGKKWWWNYFARAAGTTWTSSGHAVLYSPSWLLTSIIPKLIYIPFIKSMECDSDVLFTPFSKYVTITGYLNRRFNSKQLCQGLWKNDWLGWWLKSFRPQSWARRSLRLCKGIICCLTFNQ